MAVEFLPDWVSSLQGLFVAGEQTEANIAISLVGQADGCNMIWDFAIVIAIRHEKC